MKEKVIFFDIDGTLINFSGEFPESAKKALIEAKENGHKIIICTGRSKCQVEDRLLDFGFDGLVCAAGAYVEYCNQVIFTNFMTENQIKSVISYLENNETVYMMQCTDKIVSTEVNANRMLEDFKSRMKGKMPENISQIFKRHMMDDDIIANASSYENAEKVCYHNSKRTLEEVKKDLGLEFEVTAMSFKSERDASGEITIAGINKAFGMQKLIDHLGVSREDTVAFGDGPNDFEMIEFAGVGVAMGNATDELKAKANVVTSAIDEDGIYNGMKELGLV